MFRLTNLPRGDPLHQLLHIVLGTLAKADSRVQSLVQHMRHVLPEQLKSTVSKAAVPEVIHLWDEGQHSGQGGSHPVATQMMVKT